MPRPRLMKNFARSRLTLGPSRNSCHSNQVRIAIFQQRSNQQADSEHRVQVAASTISLGPARKTSSAAAKKSISCCHRSTEGGMALTRGSQAVGLSRLQKGRSFAWLRAQPGLTWNLRIMRVQVLSKTFTEIGSSPRTMSEDQRSC